MTRLILALIAIAILSIFYHETHERKDMHMSTQEKLLTIIAMLTPAVAVFVWCAKL